MQFTVRTTLMFYYTIMFIAFIFAFIPICFYVLLFLLLVGAFIATLPMLRKLFNVRTWIVFVTSAQRPNVYQSPILFVWSFFMIFAIKSFELTDHAAFKELADFCFGHFCLFCHFGLFGFLFDFFVLFFLVMF